MPAALRDPFAAPCTPNGFTKLIPRIDRKYRPWALTVIEVLLVIAITAILLALLTPVTSNKPTKAPKNTCVYQLRDIDSAEQIWAVEQNKTTNDLPNWSDLQPYLKTNAMKCPGGGKYTLALAGQAPACSVPEHQALFLQNWRTPVFP